MKKHIRAKKKKRSPSFRRYFLWYALVVLVLLVEAVILSLTLFFGTEYVDTRGNLLQSAQEIVATSGILQGENLFRIDRKAARERILAAYPNLDEVRLRLRLPNSVLIELTEAEPVGTAECGGGFVLLSRSGRVLESALPEPSPGYPLVAGLAIQAQPKPGDSLTGEAKTQFEILLTLLAAIETEALGDVDLIDLSDTLELKLLYQNRLAVLLGSENELDYKLRFAKYAIEESILPGFVGTLDVSTTPNARIRQRELHSDAGWPFPPALLGRFL